MAKDRDIQDILTRAASQQAFAPDLSVGGFKMKRDVYDKQLIKWAQTHYWDSLEKDKDLVLRHLRTFAGEIPQQEDSAEAIPKCKCGQPATYDGVICPACRHDELRR